MSEGLCLSFLLPPGDMARLRRSDVFRAAAGGRSARSYRVAVFDDDSYSHRGDPLVEEVLASRRGAPANGAPSGLERDGAKALLDGAVTRSEHLLADARGRTVRAQLETGALSGPLGKLPIARLTLRPEDDALQPLLDIAEALRAEFPLHLVGDSEIERAYAVLTSAGPRILRAREADLAGDMPITAAAVLILRGCLYHWLANELAVRSRLVEGVHQMRVALRRTRAALVLFREQIGPAREHQLAEEVRWLARILGSARDWDVFGDTLLDPLSVSQGEDKGLQALLRQAAERRAQAYDSVAAALDSPRYAALSFAVAALAAELAEADAGGALTTEAFAVRALQTRHAKLLRRGRHIEKLDSPARHQLRIELKKLRYRVDFFRSAFPGKRRKNFVTDLRELQDVFGVLNDVATGKRLAAELFAAAPADAHAAGGRGLVTGYLIASDRFWRDRLLAQWEAFAGAKPYWR